MEAFKKELFFKSHNASIDCYPLSESHTASLDSYILIIGDRVFIATDFFKAAKNHLKKHQQFESLESGDDLRHALQSLNFSSAQEVVLIWKYAEDMDVFDLNYLLDIWDDIWFGIADDAVALFFPKSEQLILITHYNAIYY